MVFIFLILFHSFSTGKIEKLVFYIPIIPRNFKHKQVENRKSKSINLDFIKKVRKYSLKSVFWRQCLLSPFSRNCCFKVGRYYDLHSGLQRVQRLNRKHNIITRWSVLWAKHVTVLSTMKKGTVNLPYFDNNNYSFQY